MRTSRAKFAAAFAACAAAGIPRFRAGAAEYSYKLSLQIPSTHPCTLRALEAASRIQRDSGGQFEIKVFPNGVLGIDTQVLSQVRLGAVEFDLAGDPVLASIVPVAGMVTLPFVVSNLKDALKIMGGSFGTYVRSAVSKVGVHSFPRSWDSAGGFRQIVNSARPVNTPADTQGLKLRVTPQPEDVAGVKALGATPIFVSAAEMYTAMQTHVLDGAVTALITIESFKLYEVQKYVSLNNYNFTPFTMVASADAWGRLPKKLQELTEHHFEQARNASNDDLAKAAVSVVDRLKSHGLAFNDADVPAFRKAIRGSGLYEQWKAAYGPTAWSLFEKTVGGLA